MKTYVLSVAPLVTFLFFLLPAAGQEVSEDLIDDLAPERKAAAVAREVAEDLQILSTIVREDVEQLYGVEATIRELTQKIQGHKVKPLVQLPQADRIADFGVVVQLQIPAPRKARAEEGAKPQQSRWEQTKRKLLGKQAAIPVDQQQVCAKCHQVNVGHGHLERTFIDELVLQRINTNLAQQGDVWHHGIVDAAHKKPMAKPTKKQLVQGLIETLAENGRHFRRLAPDERIRITVSYPLDIKRPGGRAGVNQIRNSCFLEKFTAPSVNSKSEPNRKEPYKPNENEGIKITPRSSHELTGDLLMKQGKGSDAVKAYASAVAVATEKHGASMHTWPAADKLLVAKLVRAHRQTGQIDKAVDLVLRSLVISSAKRGDRATFIRRVYFDFTGLPPTVEQVQEFLKDDRPDAYKKLVEKILQQRSPSIQWLDAIRSWPKHPFKQEDHYYDWVMEVMAGKAQMVVSARISVSATKSQLDRLEKGTMSREEFDKLVRIDIVDPSQN
ncbi:MAG: DUF1549 domain-containing protein [Planctomycetes bacterium]|nr:DUF1549 domain-containing protein [Planctomycetota bacterium]